MRLCGAQKRLRDASTSMTVAHRRASASPSVRPGFKSESALVGFLPVRAGVGAARNDSVRLRRPYVRRCLRNRLSAPPPPAIPARPSRRRLPVEGSGTRLTSAPTTVALKARKYGALNVV